MHALVFMQPLELEVQAEQLKTTAKGKNNHFRKLESPVYESYYFEKRITT
jgi:hypothetical protein